MSINGRDKIEVKYSANSLRSNREEYSGTTAQQVGAAAQHGSGSFIDPEIKAYLTQN